MVSNKQLIAALQTTHGKAIVEWLTDEYLMSDDTIKDPVKAMGSREVVHRLRHKSKPRSE